MPMANKQPLSPHLSIWKWRSHMTVSIFHRATGAALTFGGLVIFTWWLAAAATSPDAYALFLQCASGILGKIVLIGLSWVAFQHLLSGVRHLLMDTGWGYRIGTATNTATWTFIGSVILTIALWAVIFLSQGV